MFRNNSFVVSPAKLKTWYEKGFVVPLALRIQSSMDPWRLARPLLQDSSNGFFLDSVRFQGKTSRYSYLSWKPFRIFRSKGSVQILKRLRDLFRQYRGRKWPELPFFTGGAVGYFSYELARGFEHLPDQAVDDLGLDCVALLLTRNLVVFDQKENQCCLISNLIPGEDGSFERALGKASESIQQMNSVLGGTRNGNVPNGPIQIRRFRSDMTKRDFKRMVFKAKEYIEAGDIYQANLSQRFSFEFSGPPESLYESLRRVNPSPFSSFLRIGPLVVASVSPERLIKRDGELLETRPIAGTRPRGETQKQDQEFRRDLIMSPKERAEHIMLVDLERNDLGRVSRPRSIRVSELMTLEPYSHVIHIVSNVVGRLQKGRDQFDLLEAVFPGGTITGCPKIRSMEVIEELEPFKRHLYTGSIGYLDFNGDMDLNIVIRSLTLLRNQGYLQVGAGIVYDSDPEAEYWETLHKGKALIDALCFATRPIRVGQDMTSTQGRARSGRLAVAVGRANA